MIIITSSPVDGQNGRADLCFISYPLISHSGTMMKVPEVLLYLKQGAGC